MQNWKILAGENSVSASFDRKKIERFVNTRQRCYPVANRTCHIKFWAVLCRHLCVYVYVVECSYLTATICLKRVRTHHLCQFTLHNSFIYAPKSEKHFQRTNRHDMLCLDHVQRQYRITSINNVETCKQLCSTNAGGSSE